MLDGGRSPSQGHEAVPHDGRAGRFVVKLVPQAPGADRELLFVDLAGVAHVVPITDRGEHEGHWALVMPPADRSLREYLTDAGGTLDLAAATDVLKDIADTLVDLEGRVIHRDIKPENILLLDGTWRLADFGISRYAEATTAPETHKFALSPPYAAPERWRAERATTARDVYAVGVMAFEMLAGTRPFQATTLEEWRQAHLHEQPAQLHGVPDAVAALVDECLYKAPEARPSATNLRARLDRASARAASGGLAQLAQANRAEVSRRTQADVQASQAQSEAARRTALAQSAAVGYQRITSALREAIAGAAPAATLGRFGGGWTLRLNDAELSMPGMQSTPINPWGGGWQSAVVVIAHARVDLKIPPGRMEYEGRSHSLWFCDYDENGRFAWYETAFMVQALIPKRGRQDPFALDPGPDAAQAVMPAMGSYQIAWPFTELVIGELDEFIDRWAGWFADAAQGQLRHPTMMPERPSPGSWRQR